MDVFPLCQYLLELFYSDELGVLPSQDGVATIGRVLFHEKLRRCSAEVNKAKASASVGLKPNTISTYLAKGSMPRGDIALKIARALRVPTEWLLDDAQGWPPPPLKAESLAPAKLSDTDLMREVCVRHRLALIRLLEALRSVEKIHWEKVASTLIETPLDAPIPRGIERELQVFESLTPAFLATTFYDPEMMASQFPGEMPGENIDRDELNREALLKRMQAANAGSLSLVDDALAARMSYRGWPEERAECEDWRKRMLKEVRRKRQPKSKK